MRSLVFLIAIVLFSASISKAQENKRCKWVRLQGEPLLLDSLSVLPESIVFNSLDSIPYTYDLSTGMISFEGFQRQDSVEVCYTFLPFSFHDVVQHRSLSIYDSTAIFEDSRQTYNAGLIGGREQLFPTEGLSKNGSISRGISFGNTQDVFVNSALNLQLDGKLTDDINVKAAITDQNIPFQPEGNTQQLQEFDKVFIQFYNENASLTAGDIVLRNKPSEFLRYYKNVQGGQLTTRYNLLENSTAETAASISIAKGKFASEQLEVREGVLGPYKIRGPQNENFIIVLANSERVYLDGRLLERGYNHDYTIDYNQGEITFTNRVLITAFSRVRIDFEYSDRNYSRAILSGSHYQTIGNVNIFANYYSEKDNRNRPLTFDLGNDEKTYLSQIGDDLNRAVISGVDSVPFSSNLILYKKTDTLGMEEPVYVFSTNPDSAIFDVSFSDVGQGNGNYRLTQRNANGRVYEWVAPVDGNPQGRYEPIIAIPTPSKKQMFTLGAGVKISSHETFFSEVAISDNDVNLFSEDASGDNRGTALKGGFRSEDRVLPFLKGYVFEAGVDYEFNQRTFKPVDRFRHIEFDRNWNFVAPDTANRHDDNIMNAQIGISDSRNNLLSYKLTHRKRGDAVDGLQHFVDLSQKLGRFKVVGSLFLLNASQERTVSDWKKVDAEVSYQSRIFVPGYQYGVEQNELKAKGTDSLITSIPGLPVPLHYNAHTFFIKSNDTLRTRFNLSHAIRDDRRALNGEIQDIAKSQTTSFFLESNIKENHELALTMTYRILDNTNLEDEGKEETIMGRVDWFADLFDDHLRSELTYAVANAQEPRREFVYLKVPTGEGTHTWRDENEDGIQDLGEFYEAINPDERNYAKIFVPTDDFLLAYSSNFNYRLSFSLPRKWRSENGLKRMLSRFSNVTAWNIEKKHTDEEASARFLPFANAIEDEDLLSVNESFRSTLFYNRSSPTFGMDGGLLVSERKTLLTNGFDSRKRNEYQLNSRANINRSYTLRLKGISGKLYSSSDFLQGRNYAVEYYELRPELEWMPLNNFRLTSSYSYTDKINVLPAEKENQESALISTFRIEGRFTQVSQRTLNVNLSYINIDYKGEENTPVGYELLEALRPGNNFTWSLNLQQRIADGLQISVNYEGRKSSEHDVIHTGRMQVSALF